MNDQLIISSFYISYPYELIRNYIPSPFFFKFSFKKAISFTFEILID